MTLAPSSSTRVVADIGWDTRARDGWRAVPVQRALEGSDARGQLQGTALQVLVHAPGLDNPMQAVPGS